MAICNLFRFLGKSPGSPLLNGLKVFSNFFWGGKNICINMYWLLLYFTNFILFSVCACITPRIHVMALPQANRTGTGHELSSVHVMRRSPVATRCGVKHVYFGTDNSHLSIQASEINIWLRCVSVYPCQSAESLTSSTTIKATKKELQGKAREQKRKGKRIKLTRCRGSYGLVSKHSVPSQQANPRGLRASKRASVRAHSSILQTQ